MLPQKLRFALAILFGSLLALSQVSIVQAESTVGRCIDILKEPMAGPATIEALGVNLEYAAVLNSLTVPELKNLLSKNPTFHLDICGNGFYAEAMMAPQKSPMPAPGLNMPGVTTTNTTLKLNGVTTNYGSVFRLHSNPGSKKTIYLDFNGEKIENTAWNKNFNGGRSWVAPGFSQDSDFANFSNGELDIIQSIWQRVAEDYSPFDIDVTTEAPPVGNLERTNAADDVFGTRALISNDTVIFNSCKCSGLAYVGAFDEIGNLHDINQPAWIFTQGLGDNPKYIAEAVTHEVGHTLGLSHDGTNAVSYYPGIAGWAPIMGVGFYQPVTQWSKGDYIDATNMEDDVAVIRSHGVNLRSDEDDNSEKSARIITESNSHGGVITLLDDVDYFSFTPASSSDFTIIASTATLSPNLDISVSIYRLGEVSSKRSYNPPLDVSSTDIADGLSAKFTQRLEAGITYIVTISGTAPISNSNVYSSYGSLGTYRLGVIKGGNTSAVALSTQPAADSSLPSKLVLPTQNNSKPAALELPTFSQLSLHSKLRYFLSRSIILD
jgi:hypothetical protein